MTNNNVPMQDCLSALPSERVKAFLRALNVAVAEAQSSYRAHAWRPESEWDKAYWQGLEEALSLANEFLTEGK